MRGLQADSAKVSGIRKSNSNNNNNNNNNYNNYNNYKQQHQRQHQRQHQQQREHSTIYVLIQHGGNKSAKHRMNLSGS